MRASGKSPDHSVFPSVLKACTFLLDMKLGEAIHGCIIRVGMDIHLITANALLNMYSRCARVKDSMQVFKIAPRRDNITWNSIIAGCVQNGHFDEGLRFFRQMLSANIRPGIKPDEVVFLALLTACVHAGKVDLGLNFFNSMRLDYRIEPSMKHYSLVVDLLGRAGRLDEALNFIQKMPINPDLVIWGGLFCACRAHKNVEMAELSARKLLELEPKHPGSYVFLSNAYAAVGRWEDAERVRNLMLDKGVGKEPGWSYIELDGRLHRFVAGDNARKDAKEIQVKLEEILSGARQQGYTPGTEWVLHNIEEEEKEDALGSHSEKLALAFALIQTSPKTTIRIVKNLRICGDCHSLMKYTSAMSQREIIVRDIKRFHHFKDGTCSCGDYW
ncbi:Pentatricopeptide repeat-containing protein At1g04840 [Linum perenne]